MIDKRSKASIINSVIAILVCGALIIGVVWLVSPAGESTTLNPSATTEAPQ